MSLNKSGILRLIKIKRIFLILCICCTMPAVSFCQRYHFTLKIHFDDSSVKALGIGEAYWRSFKPLHAAKMKFDSSVNHKNVFLFEGTTLYPTAVRIWPSNNSNYFNKLIFIDTGYQEITMYRKDSSVAIKSNTPIEKEYKQFLNKMGIQTIDDRIDGKKMLTYVQKNADSYVALFAIINQAFNYPYLPIYDKINAAFGKNISQTEAFKYYKKKFRPKTYSNIDSNLLGTSYDGKVITLSAFRGKSVVLLDFWASWCIPCREMVPHLKDLYHKYHSKGLEIISVSSSLNDKKEKWKSALKKEDMYSWINLFSDSSESRRPDLGIQYGIREVPTVILID